MYRIIDNILIINYVGKIQKNKTDILIKKLLSYDKIIKEKGVKAFLVSIKVAMYEEVDILYLIKELDKVANKISIQIGITEYSPKLYKNLRDKTKGKNIQLFKNINSANLFINTKKYKTSLKVLIYDDDKANLQNLKSTLESLGYSINVAKDTEDFQKQLNFKTNDIVITQCSLSKSTLGDKAQLSLSRELIANLPVFMDTAVDTLVTFTGFEAKKKSHSIKPFDTSLNGETIASVMPFSGDLNGHFVLVFPKEVALKALEALLGEELEVDNIDAIKDGVGEFCNNITGSTKTLLSKKSMKIVFDLPKTFESIQDTLKDIGEENGVWIDMQLDGRPFYMFVTN